MVAVRDGLLLLVVALFFAASITISGVANATVFLLFLLSLLFLNKKKTSEQKLYVIVFAMPLLLAVLQMAVGYPVPTKALDAPSRLFLAAMGIFALVWLRTDYLLRAIALLVLAAVGAGVWGYLSTHVPVYFWGDGTRAWNGFSNPIPYSVLAVMFGFLALLLPNRLLSKNDPLAWGIKSLAMACAAYAAYMAQTRSSLLIVPFLSLLALRYYFGNNWRRGLMYCLPVFAMLVLFVACTENKIKNRINEGMNDFAVIDHDVNTSMGLRVEMWRTAGLIFLEHPVLGVGKAGYYPTIGQWAKEGKASPYVSSAPHPHNELLNMGVEMGVFGLLAGLLLYLFPLRLFWKNMCERDATLRFAGAAGCVVVTAFLVAGTMDVYFWIVSQTAIYGMAVTVFYALILARRRELAMVGV